MDQKTVIKCVFLLFLIHQTSTGSWYYFEADSDSTASDAEFYIEEMDIDNNGDDYSDFNDLEDKMDFHKLLIDVNLWLCVFVLAVLIFRFSSKSNGQMICFLIAVISVLNSVIFLSFPYVLEEDSAFLSESSGVSEGRITFFQTHIEIETVDDTGIEFDPGREEGLKYVWGPRFAWYSTMAIIPIFALYLLSSISRLPEVATPRKRAQQSAGPGIPIDVPNAQFVPAPTTDFRIVNQQEAITQVNIDTHNRDIIAKTQKETVESYSRPVPELQSTPEIKFSRPVLQTSFNPLIAINGNNAAYIVEGLITYSGCSEILFGTRNTDGRMVVIKKPYGYRNKDEKGKMGMVNTYTAARKQLENEHVFLSQMMKHNKENFPELLDKFEFVEDRRKEEYVVTKYFSPPLKRYINFHGTKKGGLEYERGVSLFVKIAKAVRTIHEKLGYVWADLKSENILMERDNPILIDFGTSTIPVTSKAKIKINSGGWSAPETIKGYPTFASDIYGLGKLLVYILTEITPKEKQKPEVFRAQTLHELRKRNIEPQIGEIILKCTDEEIEKRYNSINELLKDLQADSIEETNCPNCNLHILGKVKFCRNCGERISQGKSAKKVVKKMRKFTASKKPKGTKIKLMSEEK